MERYSLPDVDTHHTSSVDLKGKGAKTFSFSYLQPTPPYTLDYIWGAWCYQYRKTPVMVYLALRTAFIITANCKILIDSCIQNAL